ncbi:MAG: hypothetical protein HY594_03150 [Candidatus Omnitrophica bacterium]|nr:hypothetical protein [Candidatus Omnitrophota bacterium]
MLRKSKKKPKAKSSQKTKKPTTKPVRAGKAAPRKKVAAETGGKKSSRKSKRGAKRAPKNKKGSPAPNYGKELGRVVAFFRIPVVAVVKVTGPGLKVGDAVWIKGHTTDMKLTVASMQINHQAIAQAKKGDEIGIQVGGRARRGDGVYQLPV